MPVSVAVAVHSAVVEEVVREVVLSEVEVDMSLKLLDTQRVAARHSWL